MGKIQILNFNDFSPDLLYKVLKLRFNTFVLEQKSLYQEFDDIDYEAIHILIQKKGVLVAYMRIFKKDKETASFGRVVVEEKYRNEGYGKLIVQEGMKYIKEHIGVKRVDIEAQEYLKSFYESFGFKQNSKPFEDCGVIHIQMTSQV